MGIRTEIDSCRQANALLYEVDDGRYYDIVFLTVHSQYTIEGYDAKAYPYIIKDEWDKKLGSAMEVLKNNEKRVILMDCFLGFKNRKIAKTCGCAEAAVCRMIWKVI